MRVQTSAQLKERYDVAPIGPFGIRITARRRKDLRPLSGALLEGLLSESPLVIFRGFEPLERQPFLDFCLTYPRAELLHWETGPVMEMTPDEEAKNYLFSREAVPLHWDGAFHRVPSFLVFHCLRAPSFAGGGETLFVDTSRVWEAAAAEKRELWSQVRLTYTTEKVAHYGGAVTVDLVQRHPRSGIPVLRFAEPVETKLNPVSVRAESKEAPLEGEFLADLARRFHDPAVLYAHRWEDGDYLIADNHRLVHGRTAFVRESPRHLRRIQIL